MSNVVTEYVLRLDADLIPPPASHDFLLRSFKTTPELMNDERALLVLPALERKTQRNEAKTLLTV